jgi:hypothetical protein
LGILIRNQSINLGISCYSTPEDIPHFIPIGCFLKRDLAAVLLVALQIVVGLSGHFLLVFCSRAFLPLAVHLTIGPVSGLNVRALLLLGVSHYLYFLGLPG